MIANTSPPSADPIYRVGGLAAANKPPLSVKPDAPLAEAITLMLGNRYSQLPVMTTDREVNGVVSWTSVGTRLALGKSGDYVRDLMDPHKQPNGITHDDLERLRDFAHFLERLHGLGVSLKIAMPPQYLSLPACPRGI